MDTSTIWGWVILGIVVPVSWLEKTRISRSLFLAILFTCFKGCDTAPVSLVEGCGCLTAIIDLAAVSTSLGEVKATLRKMVKAVVVFSVVAFVRVGRVKVVRGKAIVTTTIFFCGGVSFLLVTTITTTSTHFIERRARKTDEVLIQIRLFRYIYTSKTVEIKSTLGCLFGF